MMYHHLATIALVVALASADSTYRTGFEFGYTDGDFITSIDFSPFHSITVGNVLTTGTVSGNLRVVATTGKSLFVCVFFFPVA